MAILNPFRIGQGVLGQQLGPYPYGVLNAGQVPFWDGNEFKIPSFTPQPWVYMPPAQQGLPSSSMDPQSNPNAGILAAMMNAGDGGAGNGVGGGPSAPGATPGTADFSESGHVNAPDPTTAAVAANAGVPSLPDFKENTAPSAPTAPATGMPVGEVDPQGPSGAASAGKSKGASAPSNQATAAAMASVDKALAADKAAQTTGMSKNSMVDAVTAAMQATASTIGNLSTSLGMAAAAAAAEKGITSGNNEFGKTPSEQNAAARSSASNTGSGTGSSGGGVGADGIGGPGAGGMGSPGGIGGGGSGAPGGSSDQGPGSWRKGGWVKADGDGKMEPVRGILHETEFVLTPEVTAAIQKKSPGLLHRLAKMQRMMAA